MMNNLSFVILLTITTYLMINNVQAGPTKQRIGSIDISVTIENSSVGSTAIMGGDSRTMIGSIHAMNGTTQQIDSFKSKVLIKDTSLSSTSILIGSSTTSVGSVTTK